MAQLLPLLLILAFVVPRAAAHRPLLTGPVGGAAYSTWEAALQVPWVTSSWSVKRVVECDAPVLWLKFTAERANQDVHLTAGTPAVPGLAATRPALALFGPGLPPYNASSLGFAAPPPKPGQGLIRVGSPADQSNCKFLENTVSKRSYKPANFSGVGARCGYYEPFSKAYLWITADANVTLPVKGGTYYLAAFLDGRKSTGRFTVAIANWAEDEDFKRPYQTPKGNRESVNWTDAAATPRAACCAGGKAAVSPAKAGAAKAAWQAAGDVRYCPPFNAFGCGPQPKDRPPQAANAEVPAVSPAAAAKLLKEGWAYLEVRTPEELVTGRVPGSINIPFSLTSATGGREPNADFFKQVAATFPPCTKLVVGCQVGVRSAAAANALRGRYAGLVSIDGGILQWKADGLPVIQ